MREKRDLWIDMKDRKKKGRQVSDRNTERPNDLRGRKTMEIER